MFAFRYFKYLSHTASDQNTFIFNNSTIINVKCVINKLIACITSIISKSLCV